MNLTVNSLPAKTWNRLGMNSVVFSAEADFQNHTPAVLKNPQQGFFSAHAAAQELPAETVQGELSSLLDNAETVLLRTKAEEKMIQPLVLQYQYQKNEQAVSRLVLHAEENSCLENVVVLQSADDAAATAALQIEIYAEKNAEVHLYVAQLMGADSVCCNHICGTSGENAAVEVVKLELGAEKLYAGTVLDLQGKASTLNASMAYHGKANQHLDINYVALHHGKHTESLLEAAGVLENKAEKTFRDTIDFQRGCAGAKGTENENVLLMGENLVNQTIPLILCKEEDVEGNHGASIGQLDEKILFYLASRGIAVKEAQQMIAEARIDAVCSKIPDADVCELVHEFEKKRGFSYDEEL